MPASVYLAKLALCLTAVAVKACAASTACGHGNSTDKIITRDVVIIGGGASGSHAAVSLRDMGKSVVVVEKKGVLGGHTETYWDPATGDPINIGVQGWLTFENTTDFVTRMNVSTTTLTQPALTTQYIDFTTGQPLTNYTPPSTTDELAALLTYYTVCQQYQSLILPGYFDFPASPADIPEDLTMLFSDFVTKYNLSAAVPTLFELTGLGVGDMMNTATLYVMQAVGAPAAGIFFGDTASLVPVSGDVHELYDKVAAFLGDEDVLYNTTVVSTSRPANGTTTMLVVQNAGSGERTTICAQRLLVAIEPTAENMAPFDLDEQETAVFSKFQHSNVYVGAVTSPSFPLNTTIYNLPAAAAPSQWTTLPLPSFNSRLGAFTTNSKLFRFLAVGTAALNTTAAAQQLIAEGYSSMVDSGVFAPAEMEFAVVENHGAMHLRVDGEALRAGFVQEQMALQGRRGTWWTGAAWSAQFSTVVWGFNERLLPMMVEGME